MAKGRIGPRQTFAGTGMNNTPEHLEELEARKSLHVRLIHGKPEKSFSDFLEEKMKNEEDEEDESSAEDDERPEKGAKDPHMGLSLGQNPDLAKSGKGRRAGRVIIKG